MLSPFVDVANARARIADQKMTTKMALERSLKAGDIDTAEMLSKYVQNNESTEKISSLKQTYDKADKDELVLNRQLQKEISKFPNNKQLEQEISKMTMIEKKNLYEELQLDNKLRNELQGLKLNNEDNKNIEKMSFTTKKKLLEELPKLADEWKRISLEEGLDGPDLQAMVNDAVQKLIAAMALHASKPPIAPTGTHIPMDMLLNSWYPVLPSSNQKTAWLQLQADHPDYVQTGLTKTMFINWFQGRKAGSSSTSTTPSTVAVTPSTPMKGGPFTPITSQLFPAHTPIPSGSSTLFSPAAPSSSLASQFPILSGPTMQHVPTKPAKTNTATTKTSTTKTATSKTTTTKPPVPLAAKTRSKTKSTSSSGTSAATSSGPVLAGHGLKKPKVKIPFGNLLIDAKKLKHNVLSITNQAGQKVQGFGNIEISDNLKMFFTKKKLNTKKLVLSDAERAYIQKLLIKSDAEVSKSKQTVIGSPVAYMSDDVKELRDRLEVLIGEMDANNDSPLIKDEISQIITRLVQKGKINREQAAEYIKAFIM